MGRPPSNGGPSFRFNPAEVAEMEGILQAHNTAMPTREVLISLAEKFSASPERSGKIVVQMKQVWNWFQNKKYALRTKATKVPAKAGPLPAYRDDLAAVRNVPQAPQHISVPPAIARNVPQVPQSVSAPSVHSGGKNGSDNSPMEFEAKSARDGAWYDVATFISHRSVETTDPVIPEYNFNSEDSKNKLEVLVRFAGFGPEEDEWVNVRKHVRQRSLPCEYSECVAVLPGDLILCFQEGKEQALYFDAHVLDAQRRRHDIRGCRCRFLVRYDHDQSEEIVPLRKVCRRPETDYRLQQLHAESANMNQNKAGTEPHSANTLKVSPAVEATQKQHKLEASAEVKVQQLKAEGRADTGSVTAPSSLASISTTTATLPSSHANITSVAVFAPVATATAPIAQSNVPAATMSLANNTSQVLHSSVSEATFSTDVATVPVAHSSAAGASVSTATPVTNSSVSGSSPSIASETAPVGNSDVSRPAVSMAAPVAASCISGATPSVETTMTPEENTNIFEATTMDFEASTVDSAMNSNDTGLANPVITATTPTGGTLGVAPVVHSDVPLDAESIGLRQNSSETGGSFGVENASAPQANTAVTSSAATDTATTGVVGGSSDENTLQG